MIQRFCDLMVEYENKKLIKKNKWKQWHWSKVHILWKTINTSHSQLHIKITYGRFLCSVTSNGFISWESCITWIWILINFHNKFYSYFLDPMISCCILPYKIDNWNYDSLLLIIFKVFFFILIFVIIQHSTKVEYDWTYF